jgi:hypothetical protein
LRHVGWTRGYEKISSAVAQQLIALAAPMTSQSSERRRKESAPNRLRHLLVVRAAPAGYHLCAFPRFPMVWLAGRWCA